MNREVVQGNKLTAKITVKDIYGNPVKANISAILGEIKLKTREVSIGGYLTEEIIDLNHGTYKLVVKAWAENALPTEEEISVIVHSRLPEVDLSEQALVKYLITSLVFALTIVGAFLIYNMQSSGGKDLTKAASMLKRFYYLIITGIITSVIIAYIISATSPGISILVLSLSLLGSIIAVSLWLLSESYHSILREEVKYSSLLIGILNLVAFPAILMIMFIIGANIEWFQEYVLEAYREVYGIKIPEFAITVLSTYLLYYAMVIPLTLRKLAKNIDMAKYTNGKISEDRKIKIATEMSVAIKNRIIIFLGAFGITISTHLSFLTKYYPAAIAIGLPIIVVILIIYIASGISKICQSIIQKAKDLIVQKKLIN